MTAEGGRAGDRAAFETIAAAFARTLVAGDAVALSGELGAGKTAFVAAVVRERLGADVATSPTFAIWHRYGGSPPLEHLDLYRLEPPDALELGLHEAFGPEGIALVEWPERLPGLLPASAIRVRIDGVGDGPRTIAIERP